VASRYFIDVAATPPQLRRGVSHKFKLRHYRRAVALALRGSMSFVI
jgi:hypothetical protein